jgi:6-phosphogluconolactonase
MDKVMAYTVDGKTGTFEPAAEPYVTLEPGSGPRHMTIHPTLPVAYVINEIGNTIAVMDYDDAAGTFRVKQYVETLPGDFTGQSHTADIHTSPDGAFLYGSNRGHDSLAIYSIDAADGTLTSIGHEPTGGKNPRNFAVAPEGRFVLAANQDSDSILVFRRNEDSGRLDATGTRLEVPKPVCIKFLV